MSPEQVKEHPVDHQTDIYSMGVVMYHLLTGRLPFNAANNFSLIYQITNVEPDAPTLFRPEIPEAVEAIVRHAMAKDLSERYRQWEDFSLDLAEAFLAQHEGAHKAHEFADSHMSETLRKLPFFGQFSDAELWEVARMSTWRHAGMGELLMKEGEAGRSFCTPAPGHGSGTKRGNLPHLLRARGA